MSPRTGVVLVVLGWGMVSLCWSDTGPANAIIGGLPVVLPAPIRTLEAECLLSQVCERAEKIISEEEKAFSGALAYRLRQDVAYLTGDGRVARVKEVVMRSENQANMKSMDKAIEWCSKKEQQLVAFYTSCGK